MPVKLEKTLGDRCRIRLVDQENWTNKDERLIEEGFLTVSTIASAKGYDAPIVFLLGADNLATDTQGRASFYVAATRAKFRLIITGVRTSEPTLLVEIIKTGEAYSRRVGTATTPKNPVVNASTLSPIKSVAVGLKPSMDRAPVCKFCQSTNVHGQHGRYGYFFKCIDCLKNTKMTPVCSRCGKPAKVRKSDLEFFSECKICPFSELMHRNRRLEDLEE